MAKPEVLRAQKQILKLVAQAYPEVYLVGGTALNLLYHHRISEDLDFFTQDYSGKLHREITAYIKRRTGFNYQLIVEEKRRQYLPMAVYEFEVGRDLILKVDFVKDVVDLFKPRNKNGIAPLDDLYYRKMLAVVGWKAGDSKVGKLLTGGRQKTKDLFDVYYLSAHVRSLNEWFPDYFDQNAYERLTAWYLGVPKQKTIMELLDLVPGCDTKTLFKHLDNQIITKLNQKFASL